MLISSFLRGRSFDVELTAAMSRAFLAACRRLRLADREPLNEIVAAYIIELGLAGTRDPAALYKLTVAKFKVRRQP